jgi:hypothetical protein
MAIVRVSATVPAANAAALPATDRAADLVARVVMDLAPVPVARVVTIVAATTAVLPIMTTPRPSAR